MQKVLVVDDNAVNREYLMTLLAYKGYETAEARDGAEALGLARSAHPDLIITDILMPTMDGYEFVRQLRLDPNTAHMAVIFCTASFLEREAERLARDCGVANLMVKPCEPEVVLRLVEAALSGIARAPQPPPSQHFDRDHLTLLTNKLSQKSTELEIANQRLSALIDISLRMAAETDSARMLEYVGRAVRELIGAGYAAIAASGRDSLTPDHFFMCGVDEDIVRRVGIPAWCDGLFQEMFKLRAAIRRGSLPGQAEAAGLPAHFPTTYSVLVAPICSPRRIHGWLCVANRIGSVEFSDEDQRLATIMGEQLGRMYENATLFATSQAHAAELGREIDERRLTQQKLQDQLRRLDLLQQITRAIGERQDLHSIFQVVIRRLEDDLPVDFGCVCLYEPGEGMLRVTSVGTRSIPLAIELAMTERARIPVDSNGMSRCVQGHLIYEPDISQTIHSFPQRLARGGLGAFVAVPLIVDSAVIGVVIVARARERSFSSGECEFLRHVGEHVALASHQAQIYSALQSAYDDLRRSQQAIMQQERLRSLGQMASGVAHDINNAISPVSLYTELLLEHEPNLSDRSRGYLDTIRRAIGDVALTVGRMRDFYRPTEAQASLVSIDLDRLVQQVMDFSRAKWKDVPEEKGIVIDVRRECQPDLPRIMGAENEIRDALTNLIFNAVDSMPAGGSIIIRTYATAAQPGTPTANVVLEVSDTGTGMDEETRSRCLEPFFTTKGERGTGLGLAMVYGMTQRHGAEIEIESRLNVGTTIRLIFPSGEAKTALDATQQLTRPTRPLRVLVVDDDPIVIHSMRAVLESDGHRVTTSDGGKAGIDAFIAAQQLGEPFEVVITDLGMPYVDGRKVAASVKQCSPRTPVILLTGWGVRLVADDENPEHVDRILCKPAKLAELRRELAELTAHGAIVTT